MVLASRSNRCLCTRSCDSSCGRNLIATVRSRRVSRARYTSPIPPAPSGETISYGPSLLPRARAIIARDYTLGIVREHSDRAQGLWKVGTLERSWADDHDDTLRPAYTWCVTVKPVVTIVAKREPTSKPYPSKTHPEIASTNA